MNSNFRAAKMLGWRVCGSGEARGMVQSCVCLSHTYVQGPKSSPQYSCKRCICNSCVGEVGGSPRALRSVGLAAMVNTINLTGPRIT